MRREWTRSDCRTQKPLTNVQDTRLTALREDEGFRLRDTEAREPGPRPIVRSTGQMLAVPPHPACGRHSPEGRGEEYYPGKEDSQAGSYEPDASVLKLRISPEMTWAKALLGASPVGLRPQPPRVWEAPPSGGWGRGRPCRQAPRSASRVRIPSRKRNFKERQRGSAAFLLADASSKYVSFFLAGVIPRLPAQLGNENRASPSPQRGEGWGEGGFEW